MKGEQSRSSADLPTDSPGQSTKRAAAIVAEQARDPEELKRSEHDENLRYKGDTRKYRGMYAKTFLAFLGGQLLITNSVFVAVGLHKLDYDPITIRIFVGATIAQVVSLVLVIVRHFFPIRPRLIESRELTAAGPQSNGVGWS